MQVLDHVVVTSDLSPDRDAAGVCAYRRGLPTGVPERCDPAGAGKRTTILRWLTSRFLLLLLLPVRGAAVDDGDADEGIGRLPWLTVTVKEQRHGYGAKRAVDRSDLGEARAVRRFHNRWAILRQ